MLAKLGMMVKIVNMHEAKTTLSKLVEAAEAGESVVLARAGRPVVKLVPISSTHPKKLGLWKGKIKMAKDFDAPLPEDELAAWERGR